MAPKWEGFDFGNDPAFSDLVRLVVMTWRTKKWSVSSNALLLARRSLPRGARSKHGCNLPVLDAKVPRQHKDGLALNKEMQKKRALWSQAGRRILPELPVTAGRHVGGKICWGSERFLNPKLPDYEITKWDYCAGGTYSFGLADPSPKKNISSCFTMTS